MAWKKDKFCYIYYINYSFVNLTFIISARILDSSIQKISDQTYSRWITESNIKKIIGEMYWKEMRMGGTKEPF